MQDDYNDDPLIGDDPLSPLIEKRNRLQLLLFMLGKGFLIYVLPLIVALIFVIFFLMYGEKDTGALMVTADRDSVQVVFNGSVIFQSAGEVVANLTPGFATVSVQKRGFTPEPPEFLGQITAAETLKVHFRLIPVPLQEAPATIISSEIERDTLPWKRRDRSAVFSEKTTEPGDKVISGAIIVTSNIKGAQVYLNGEFTGKHTNASLDSIPAGDYRITVNKEYFELDVDTQSVTIERDLQTEILHFYLKPVYDNIKPEISVETFPVEGDIFIDGEHKGRGKAVVRSSLDIHKVTFGEVKNFTTPADMFVELTERNPVQTARGEYTRIIGNCAVAIVRPADESIEADKFEGDFDGQPYFKPNHGVRQGYLLANLPPGNPTVRGI
ncbi:MAG: PEGA domain-containing protein, partial [FCB group bacterium]|nr:PEGA domain-containing protein [FCB group bacterium]